MGKDVGGEEDEVVSRDVRRACLADGPKQRNALLRLSITVISILVQSSFRTSVSETAAWWRGLLCGFLPRPG